MRDRGGAPARALRLLALPLLALAFLPAHTAVAGSMPLEWSPVGDSDVAGYKVYYGTSSGNYGAPIDAGSATNYTLGNLVDCTRYYIAVKAYDTSGNQSVVFSDEVVGLATPTTATVSPSASERGQTLTVTVSGTNFDAGATASFLDPKIMVTSATLVSCTQLRVTLTIAADAAIGARTLEVTNADGSYVSRPAAFQVSDATAPAVTASVPAPSATGVPVTVQPTVTFSEAMDPASITAASVVLLKSDGTPVAQAAGSPSLDTARKTAKIVPASSLQNGAVYRIQIIGGAGGARDAMGTPLASTFTQSPGFTTVAAPASSPAVASTSPSDGATNVPVGVQPTVTFSEALLASSVTSATLQLLAPDGSAVPQGAGSPFLDAAGTTVTIVPAAPLAIGTNYKLRVVGGASGVKDLASTPMTSTFTQTTGFTTKNAPGQVQGLKRKDRH